MLVMFFKSEILIHRKLFDKSRRIFGCNFCAVCCDWLFSQSHSDRLAYLDHVDAIALLALRMAFSVFSFVVAAIWVNHQPEFQEAGVEIKIAGACLQLT